MAIIGTYAWAAVLRNGYRTLGMLLGTLLATGLLSAVLFYIDASAAHMTQTALVNVPVDLQVIATSSDLQLTSLRTQLAAQAGVAGLTPFSLASFSRSQLTGERTTATTAGALLAVEPYYFTLFAHPQIVQGQFSRDGVLISKDLATNLGAKPGDSLQLHFAAPVPAFSTKVSGIVDMAGADLLFAPTDVQHRQAAFNPPANVIIIDYARFNEQLRAALLTTAAQPVANGPAVNGVVSANTRPVVEQLHIHLDRAQLPGDPLQAQSVTEQLRRRLERQAPGQITVLNNLSDVIENVKGDILWAKILVVFLAGPGILLAAYLSRYATVNLIAAQRRELALLRARGATPNQVMGISMAISAIIAMSGVMLGLMLGLGTVVWATNAGILSNGALLLNSALVTVGAGLLFALGAIILPTRALYLAEVQAGRRQVVEEGRQPIWQRFHLDLLCLVTGLSILVITQRNGFAPVVNGEGNATLSLSLFTFLAPALIWVGTALLLLRLSDPLFKASTGILARGLRLGFGPVGLFVARGLTRRYRPLQQVALIIALTVAFGISLSGFATTYQQQQRVDAELTLGADVRVTPAQAQPQTGAFADQLRSLPGVLAVSPFDINVAYVGSELQDLFGVNVFSLRQSTTLADSFFLNASADSVLSRLAATPSGIIVSEETARDYSVVVGDHMNIRLPRADARTFVTVNFEVVGVAREFPTAPKDSFLVVNQAFLHQQIGRNNISTFLIRATGDPAQLAATLRTWLADPTLTIESISQVTARLSSTLTTLSLETLTRIEWAYTLLIAALALAIFLFGLLAERATEYATLSALGATPCQVNAFVLAEAIVGGLVGLIIGCGVGLTLTQVFVTILTAIFDPPPLHTLIPIDTIALLLLLVAMGLTSSMTLVMTVLRRLALAQVLRNA
ncbi:hypothetical protein BH10CHL1_BH10CHL1_06320 [soil metagenome]